MPTIDKTPLKAEQSIVYAGSPAIHEFGMTVGCAYTVLENECTENGWRIIRVVNDDGITCKASPAVFARDGIPLGCDLCFDRGITSDGEPCPLGCHP